MRILVSSLMTTSPSTILFFSLISSTPWLCSLKAILSCPAVKAEVLLNNSQPHHIFVPPGCASFCFLCTEPSLGSADANQHTSSSEEEKQIYIWLLTIELFPFNFPAPCNHPLHHFSPVTSINLPSPKSDNNTLLCVPKRAL